MYYFEKVATWNSEIRMCNHFLVSEFIKWPNHQSDLKHVNSNIFYLYWKYLYLYSGVKIKIVTDKQIIWNKYQP